MSPRPLRKAMRDDFEETTDIRWSPVKWLFTALLVVLVIAGVFYGIRWITQPMRTAEGVRERVGNADNALFQYEKFHDACGGIVAFDKQHTTALKAIEDHDKRTKDKPDPLGRNADEASRLRQVADGILLTRQKAAEQYNADSRKWSQGLFKSKSLPYRIDDTTPECDS